MKIENNLISDSHSSCPDAATLERYVSGKLSSSEQHEVEVHLIDCAFCDEAIEGLQAMNEKEPLTNVMEELDERLSKKIQPAHQARIKVLFPRKMAAAIALLIGSMALLWLFIPREDTNQLFTQEFKPYPPPPATSKSIEQATLEVAEKEQPAANEAVISREENRTISAEQELRVKGEKDVAGLKPTDEPTVSLAENTDSHQSADNQNNFKESVAAVPVAPESEMKRDVTLSEEAVDADATALKAVTATPAREKRAAAKVSNGILKAIHQDFKAGLDAYQKQNYPLAISYLSKCKEPSDARFYLGLSYLADEQAGPALEQFKLYLDDKNATRKEAAYWYSALAAIKSDRKREARILLQKVIPFRGEFEKEASDLLKKL